MSDKWPNYLDSLVAWASDKEYHVEFIKNGDNSMCHISKMVEINSSFTLERQIYCLLHECGHILIFDSKKSEYLNAREKYDNDSHGRKVYTVLEEHEAWKRGKKLAKRLGIIIDEDKWEKEMIKALKKYIDWAAI